MLSINSLNYLLTNQKKIDKYIISKFKLNNCEIFDKKILAFLIELSEFINEQRDFKYWSVKPSSIKDILLEEYVDGIHFLISIGNSLLIDFKTYKYNNKFYEKDVNLTKIYLDCFSVTLELIKNNTSETYFKVLNQYLFIADKLNFTEGDLLKAYNNKNKINFYRQKNKY